jgi:hypothetical protein
MVGCLNSTWWDEHIANKRETRLGRGLVESVMMYGSNTGVGNGSQKNLQTVEMDHIRRSAKKSKLERVRSEEIKQILQAEETLLERIEIRKQMSRAFVENAPRKVTSQNPRMDTTGKNKEWST